MCVCMSDIPAFRRLPPRPDLEWRDDGVPRDTASDDVYFSTSSGLEETREVFFRGCGLPQRWRGRGQFTVAELGFGTGLNVVALLELWRSHRPSSQARLNIVSFEGRLMARADAEAALAAWPELALYSARLLREWPDRMRGVQRLDLGDGVTLTLHQDEIGPAIGEACFQADAWFLDGFSPAKNPDMWAEDVMAHVARLSAPGALIGTYTVAGHVRRSLAAAGFNVSKQPGFGRKRERLEAVFPTETQRPSIADIHFMDVAPVRPGRVIVIGAGIQGACAAYAYGLRGAQVTVLESAEDLNAGSSANPLGLVMPRLDAADTPQARMLIESYLYARRYYARLSGVSWSLDVAQPARHDSDVARYAKLLSDPPLDETSLAPLDASGEGLRHLGAVAVDPVKARRALLASANVQFGASVAQVLPGDAPSVRLSSGEMLEADLIVVSAGMGLAGLLGKNAPPVSGRAGQLEYCSYDASAPGAIASGHYAVMANDMLVFGASFTPCEEHAPPPDMATRQDNLEALAGLDEGVRARIDTDALKSRTGVRATTPDRMPFVGYAPDTSAFEAAYGDDLKAGRRLAPPDAPPFLRGVQVVGGLGARGLTWAPWLADISAALSFGEPLATERRSLEMLSVARFQARSLRRG